MSSQDDPAAACPVDHKTRDAWLAQAHARANSSPPTTPAPSPPSASSPLQLGTARQVSTIPRASASSPSSHQPANSERDTGADPSTGHWIYPSEQMFFDAMRRKSYDARASDMRTIVPIHNAVNERAWLEIQAWEKGRGSEACGGPRLASFTGRSTRLTPRARWRTWLGYQPPFDRHDWVVDRCGERVDYVIDFYAGRGGGAGAQQGDALNFFLDVRPKLNSWEGCKMRVAKYWGF
ncbi:Cytochrome c1 heme lyase [Pleosporales sp. CAS-2024a]